MIMDINKQGVVILNATLVFGAPVPCRQRKDVSVNLENGQFLSDGKITHELAIEFLDDVEEVYRVGAQITSNKEKSFLMAHMVIFRDNIPVGRSLGWVPVNQTISLAVSDSTKKFELDCCVTYKK